METLNSVPYSGTFQQVVNVINENMSIITDAVSSVEARTDKFSGIYTSASVLPTTGVSEGTWAAVLGPTGFPAEVYIYTNGAWADSGGTWEPDSAATAAVEEAKDEAIAEIEAIIADVDLTYEIL